MQEALYRKYRPDSLKKLVGQPDAVALIEKQVKNSNLSHAYLFSGPRGVGKTSLARIIATTLGCDPVFDITEIDAASHNKVDDIRELNDSINFIASSPGKKRVFILDEVHMLSNAASNAFLKTLEEPPEHVIFILATTEPERVLETIKSRTTHIAFKRIGNDEIISTLNEIGKNEKISMVKEIHFPHSIGLLYSAFTYFIGFEVNDGEYKLMGLAPYGEPKYTDKILNQLKEIGEKKSIIKGGKNEMKYIKDLNNKIFLEKNNNQPNTTTHIEKNLLV